MDPTTKLNFDIEDAPLDKGRYQCLVGKLIHLAHTRPDIAFSVSCVSQCMHSSLKKHMVLEFQLLKHLKCTPSIGLLFRRNEE